MKFAKIFDLNKEKLSKNVFAGFLVVFFVYTLAATLESSHLWGVVPHQDIINVRNIRQIVWFFSILLIAFNKYSVKNLKIGMFLFIFLLQNFSSTGFNNNFTTNHFTVIIVCFAMANRKIELPIKTLLFGTIVGFVAVILAYLFGIIEHVYEFRLDSVDEIRVRNPLGFNLAVISQGLYLNIALAFIYLNRYKLTLLKLISILIPGAVIYYLTGSRNSFALLVMAVICSLIFKSRKNEKASSLFYYGSLVAFFGLFLFSVITTIMFDYDAEGMQLLDHFTSQRLAFQSSYWDQYSLTLFGQRLHRVGTVRARITGEPRMILDNAFLNLILESGLILTSIITIALTKLLKKLKENQDVISLIIWLIAIVSLLLASATMYFWRNPLLFQFSFLLINNNRLKEGR